MILSTLTSQVFQRRMRMTSSPPPADHRSSSVNSRPKVQSWMKRAIPMLQTLSLLCPGGEFLKRLTAEST